MKIGLVLPSTPGYSETFFTNKVKGLQAQGHEVILFVNAANTPINFSCKVKITPKLSGSFISVFFISALSLLKCLFFNFRNTHKLFIADKKDGISLTNRIKNIISSSHILPESLDWLHFGFGTMALGRENIAKAIGARMAVSFRGFDIGIYPVKNPDCYKLLWEKVDKIHVISDDIEALVYKYGFKGGASIIKITPAIDTDYFKCGVSEVINEVPEFITIARLNWKKGLEYTLQALSIFKQQKIRFHCTIVGDGIEKEKLLFAVHQLGLKDYVTFTGKLSPEKVKEKLQSADLYLQYSIQEGFCNAVLEAQAMGKICIVSDAEGLTENVIDGVTGFVVPKRSPDALATKIIEALQLSDSEKNTISQNAVRRVKTEFNLEQQRTKFLDFYEVN